MSANPKKSAEQLLADLISEYLKRQQQLLGNPELQKKQRHLLQLLAESSNADDDGLPASFLNDNDPPENDSMFKGGPEVQAKIKQAASRLFPPKHPRRRRTSRNGPRAAAFRARPPLRRVERR